ncbi:hypothetical protein HUJ04_003890 [Dendroctonus ponderosae]|nr:hypothetical protein HUJ04_003890 [Dendroctonus ponderosae]KAH1004083.1 hypothetical protein HUJ04_003890 [Dendroctonus ponderosae]
MALQNNETKVNMDNVRHQQPWFGSKTSCTSDKSVDDTFMTFQSKDPIINIPLDKVPNKDKVPGSAGGHGIPVEHPTSYVETLMHLLKGNVGSGIFAMGDGIRNAGIIVGPIVVLILGVICTHCQHLLVLDYYGYVLDVHFHMAIILLPILLTALIRNLKYLAPFSTLANVLMCIGIIIVIYYASQDVPSVTERRYIADWQQLPLFFGTAIYAFEGIGLVLPLQNEMKKPGQFTKPLGVLNSGMVIVTIMYLVVGCLSYMKYGDDIRGSVTLNLPQHEVLAQSVKIIIPCGILLTYALQFYIAVDIIWPNILALLGPNVKYPIFAELSFRSFLVLVTFVLAEAIPFLGLFISLVGAVSSAALALIFPPILDTVSSIAIGQLTSFSALKNGFIILIGVVGMITGSYESISAIVKAFGSES